MHYQSPFLRNKLKLENWVELKLEKLLFISREKVSFEILYIRAIYFESYCIYCEGYLKWIISITDDHIMKPLHANFFIFYESEIK